MRTFPAQTAPDAWARRRHRAAVLLGAAGVVATTALPAAAQYPSRPIRIIAAAASGGGVDTIARVVGQKLAETWGQPVVVENRAGGGGTLGSELVAKSPADGHTLLAISIGHAVVPSLYRTLSYDPARDLVPITILVSAPNILVVHPSVPARSVAELLALARARPGEIYYSSSGNGSPPHLAVEYLKLVTKTDMVHVPYKGTAPGITDLIAGRVSLTFASITSAMPHVQTGKLRVLAVAGSRRAASHPQIPTVAEAGVAGYDVDVWYAALAPAGTPREVMSALNREMARALRTPDLQPRFTALGLEPVGNPLEAAQAYVQSEITKWSKVVRAAGIKAD